VRRTRVLLATAALAAARMAPAEPMFLAHQYTRCTTCHYSETGGGLLTPYGRSLSRQDLSTTGRGDPEHPQGHEEAFLWGAPGKALGPIDAGIDIRPSYLRVAFAGTSTDRDLLMNADALAAYHGHGWTVYGELGRMIRPEGAKLGAYEYWVAHESASGLGVRLGRFFPAYGLRLADHTAFTRAGLGFDKYDQVLGAEVTHTSEHRLLQVSLSPGPADAVFRDDGRRAFTATGRFQADLGPRTALVVSGLFRAASALEARSGAGGVAFGFAPTSRLSIWTQADARVRAGASGASYTLLNETSIEMYRGLWLKLSPQLRTDFGTTSPRSLRMVIEADLLPRTHWNLDASWYWDHDRVTDLTSRTLLAQLHLYL